MVIEAPATNSKYMRDFPRSARIDLETAMEALSHRRAFGGRWWTSLPDAIEVTLAAAGAAVLGPLLIVGLTVPILRKIWDQANEGSRQTTYHGALKLIEVTDGVMHHLSNVSMSDKRWGAVRANLSAIELLINILQGAR